MRCVQQTRRLGDGRPALASGVRGAPGQLQGVCARQQLRHGAVALAYRIGSSILEARNLQEIMRRTFPTFARWSDAAVDHALLTSRIESLYGWTLRVEGAHPPRRSKNDGKVRTWGPVLRNFHMQSNGAEMLRLAWSWLHRMRGSRCVRRCMTLC